GLAVGPNGDLFVSARSTNDVLRYDGNTGAFLGTFVSPGSGGLNAPDSLAFGPDGNLYVTSTGFNGGTGNYPSVLRYDGTTGAFLGTFASGGGLSGPQGLQFGLDGNLYVSSFNTNQILRYSGTTGAAMGIFASGNTLGGPTYFAFRQTHTATTVSPSVNPSVFGQSVTFTASVSNLG